MDDKENQYPIPTAYQDSKDEHKVLKKIMKLMRKTILYKKLRSSRMNPYHTFLTKVNASNIDDAKIIGRRQNLGYILYNGIRVSTELDCCVSEEFEQYGNVIRDGEDVTTRIPKNAEGKIDLFAEEPVVIAIVPVEGPSLTGHAAMQYKDRVVNRRGEFMDKNSIFETYGKFADYYFIYPSQLGIDTKKLEEEMDKTYEERSGKYNIVTNNCAGAVGDVLKKIGMKIDFFGPDDIGLTIPTPGNNPFGIGIRNWCIKNGIHVRHHEMLTLYNRHKKIKEAIILSKTDLSRN